MSAGAGTREVAWRLFAAEYEDASFSYSESDEERAPNYVVTPTGARVNRVFVVGVLTEIEEVGDGVLRARVVDPTGAFVVYAGQYQPDAMAFLERATPPTFVAVTGKARTFQPEDSDVVYTSIRPESINEVDADTRDRWVVQTAEQTVDRVRTVAAALDRPERGDDLQAVLAESGVDDGLASGIPVALEEYGTTSGYLAAVRDLALDAVRVVADEREEAGELSLAPDEGGDVDALADVTATTGASSSTSTSSTPSTDAEPDTSAPTADEPAAEADSEPEPELESETEAASEPEADAEPEPEQEAEPEPAESATATATAGGGSQPDATATDSEPESEPEPEPETGSEPAESDPEPAAEEPAASADDADSGDDAGPATDEMYEFDEEERAEIEENYDMGFSSGSDIPEQGEADIDTPEDPAADADEEADASESAPASEPEAESEPEPEAEPEPADDVGDEADDADEEDVEPAQAADVDLEDAVMETMQDLDDGSGADRADLVDTVTAEYGVTADDVEAAIQDALMSGRCYEPDDDTIVPI